MSKILILFSLILFCLNAKAQKISEAYLKNRQIYWKMFLEESSKSDTSMFDKAFVNSSIFKKMRDNTRKYSAGKEITFLKHLFKTYKKTSGNDLDKAKDLQLLSISYPCEATEDLIIWNKTDTIYTNFKVAKNRYFTDVNDFKMLDFSIIRNKNFILNAMNSFSKLNDDELEAKIRTSKFSLVPTAILTRINYKNQNYDIKEYNLRGAIFNGNDE